MFEENWFYRMLVILSLCIILLLIYFMNEDTILDYARGKFVLDLKLIWQMGIFAFLGVVLFYLMNSVLDYKGQNAALKRYLQGLQQELGSERDDLKDLKLLTSQKLMHLESFIVTISDMARQINSVLETDELLGVLLRKTVDLLGPKSCAIFRVNEKEGRLIHINSVGYKKKEILKLQLKPDEESGQVGLAAKTGLFVSRQAIGQDYTRKYILDNDKIPTSFCQPILYNSKSFAVICVDEVSKNLTHDQSMRLLSTMANFGSVALTNTKLVDRIREQSIRDSLTWLYNHQYFQLRLDLLLNQAKGKKLFLGLIILDLDHFKRLNDTYGHQAGDFVLKKSAQILSSQLRKGDVLARYGGEEFVIILPGRDDKSSYEIAERLRKTIEENAFEFEGQNFKITISAGVSSFDPYRQMELKRNLLIKYADEALYEAKRAGRNKVIIH